MGYEFDIFLSYPRRGGAGRWVRDLFYPALRECLEDAMPEHPAIFFDQEQEAGVAWPENLAYSLSRSRLMVAVLSPPYFRGKWCLAEWTSMRERERRLGLGNDQNPTLLVHPVRFADGEHFSEDAREVQHIDFREWNVPRPMDAFQRTGPYEGFYQAVQELARTLAGRRDHVPEWEPDWPILRPDPVAGPPSSVPRL